MDAVVGRRAHDADDRKPPRVVRLAAAHLGNADPRTAVRRLPGVGRRSGRRAHRGRALSRRRCGRVVDRTGVGVYPAGLCVPELRRHGILERDEHRRHLVRVGRDAPRGAEGAWLAVAGRRLPRRRRSISRLVPFQPDHRRRDRGCTAVQASRLHRVGRRSRRSRDAQVGRQLSRRARSDGEVRRRRAAAVGRIGRLHERRPPGREAARKRCQRLPQPAQSLPLVLGFGRRSHTRCARAAQCDGAVGPAGPRETRCGCGRDRRRISRFPAARRVRGAAALRQRRSLGVLRRCAQGPSLHQCTGRNAPAQRTIRDLRNLPHDRGARRTDPLIHRRGSVADAAGGVAA